MTIDGYLNGSGQLRLSVPFNAGMAALDVCFRGLDAYRVRCAWRENDHVRAVDFVLLYVALAETLAGTVLSLPMGAHMTLETVDEVAAVVRAALG